MTLTYLLIAAFLLPGSGPRSQSAEPLKVYFSLSAPDRSTREAWLGHRLDQTVLAEWAKVLEETLAQGTAPFVPVGRPDIADVVVEIRRCQIQEDGSFVMAGVVDPEARGAPFELTMLHTPSALRASLSAFPRLVRRILESN
ncbi:MAG: hypothetical protein ACRD1X_00930 [Vicinamibacteria bacterium]